MDDDGPHSNEGASLIPNEDGGNAGHSHVCSEHKEVERQRLIYTLALSMAFVVAEIIAAAIANSLSLLADALHHLVDAVIVVTALIAVELARRVSRDNELNRVYVDEDGNRHHFIELLVAMGNSILLASLSAGIIFDAILRLHGHEEFEGVNSAIVIGVGVVSLVVNIVKVVLLHPHMTTSLNVRAVYIHTIADVAGALALTIGGFLVHYTGDNKYDSIFAVVIASLVIVNVGWVVVPTIRLLYHGPDPRGLASSIHHTVPSRTNEENSPNSVVQAPIQTADGNTTTAAMEKAGSHVHTTAIEAAASGDQPGASAPRA